MAVRRMLFAAVLCSAQALVACSAAWADRPTAPGHIALEAAPARLRAPYDVQIVRSDGEPLPTYSFRDRFYVQGRSDERYTIRITNPTGRRIEAVVSVDGLDVIDGENGDLRKRGYVVPAYGETRIEGFRTSQSDVATFRFSSVSGSYAGQNGKPRNVGVIAVALFEEQAVEPEQQIIVGGAPPRPQPRRRYYDDRDDRDSSRDAKAGTAAAPPATSSAPRHAEKRAAEAAPAVRPAPPPSPPAPGPSDDADAHEDLALPHSEPYRPRERLGLGTEFGEQRYSAVGYTRFVRAPGRPVAIAELRYNDVAGLLALGIPVQPLPDAGELMTRETADPFPGDRFARPPR